MTYCYTCGYFEDDIGCFNPFVDNVEECSFNRPSYLDCYNCTDICSDCPITGKEIDNNGDF